MKMERTALMSEWDRQTSLLAELREIFFSFIFAEIRATFRPTPIFKSLKMGSAPFA
jgi:hypothetical protein